ncbi:Ig-like domain-containing protein, partial [Arenibacterium sp. CAU 1754]
TFTPAPDYDGAVPQISYTLSDGAGGTDTATLDITLTPVNDAPVGVDDVIPVTEDTTAGPVNVLGNDLDVEGDPLTIATAEIDVDGDGIADPLTLGAATPITDAAGNPIGTLTVAASGDVTFDPAPDYIGPVPDLTYVPNDGTEDGSPATVSFGPIVPVNDAPVATDDAVVTDEDVPVSGNLITDDLGGGIDSDVDGDPLGISAAEVDVDGDGIADALTLGTATPLVTAAGDPIGDLTVNGDGSFTFTPAPDYDGAVPQISYTLSDGAGGTDTATLDITLTPVNDVSPSNSLPEVEPLPADEEPEETTIIVDHILDEVAGTQNDLFGTPPLLSGMNTNLEAPHPILLAVNAIQNLGGTEPLPIEGVDGFSSLKADTPISSAVRGIGFEPLLDDVTLFDRDFPNARNLGLFEGQVPEIGVIVTARGDAIQINGGVVDGVVTLKVSATDTARSPVAIDAIEFNGTGQVNTMTLEDGSILITAESWSSFDRLEIALGNGNSSEISVDADMDGQGEIGFLKVAEVAENTFSSQTDRLTHSGEFESAKLMQALTRGAV